ncbi:MAG: redoxin domain-containing protein [Rhodovibrionaceae bacterium]
MPSSQQSKTSHPPLEAGDLVPVFVLPKADGSSFALNDDAVSGKPTVLVLCRDPSNPQAAALLQAFERRKTEIAALGAQLLVLTRQSTVALLSAAAAQRLSLPLLADPGGKTFARFGLWPTLGPIVLLLGANRHLRWLANPAGEDTPDDTLERLRAEAARRQPVSLQMHPPVLLLPDVLSREECRHLIHLYDSENDNWQEPGHGSKNQTSNYKVRVPEYGRKDRIDHFLAETGIQQLISFRLQNRLFPEIHRAFQYRVTRAETYRIGCYEGERGGIQHGHRDNTQELVAHRRFACSINLDREAFEGGELRFPEFGDQRYQPETGAAICFSSSLLHEALEVTQGKRYVLMAFLFGES